MALDIEINAQKPLRASGDSGSVEQHSLKDQILAEKYLASKQATIKGFWGLKLFRIRAGGAI
jgi:hypothetical protein